MEGSAISRSITGPMRICNKRDPDGDGMDASHIPSASIVSNVASPKGLGRDSYSLPNPSGSIPKIKGGQNG